MEEKGENKGEGMRGDEFVCEKPSGRRELV